VGHATMGRRAHRHPHCARVERAWHARSAQPLRSAASAAAAVSARHSAPPGLPPAKRGMRLTVCGCAAAAALETPWCACRQPRREGRRPRCIRPAGAHTPDSKRLHTSWEG